ncbi:NDR1/HIN1-like protein 6 isoform X2 [Salvia miltiorrhiza]|uniref:NDR1/HIN1-like protein 6 isoform X2 n=1 Tax=Salvia miltiorrhiza TaxID=226208 RepID=UPI0025AD06AD|nr:NDR1/HIN1-like protein 6 isoform X2 [Salvia miltiorrhiza]
MRKETSSHHSPCQDLNIPFSFKKTLLFFLLFIFLVIFIVGVPLLCMFFVLKPKMPDFSLQNLDVESYKLDLSSQNLVVSSVFALNLKADNPNKVGLSFEASRFYVLSQGLVVGLIRIPQFHQPPLSKNVSVQTRVLFECVNVSEIMDRNSRKYQSSKGASDDIRILGDVSAQVRIFNIVLPKIKFSLPLNSQTVSKKCSLAILM